MSLQGKRCRCACGGTNHGTRKPIPMTQQIYRGRLMWVSNGEEDELLGLLDETTGTSEILAERLKDDRARYGACMSVHYYLSDSPLTADELPERLLRTLHGDLDAEYGVRYSEITGYLWTNEMIHVGGHDLLAELQSGIGQFLHLDITYRPTGA